MRRTLRRLHLYLGCVFAPLLLFFTMTGLLQSFGLHADQKNGYTAPRVLKEISEIHLHQRIGQLDSERPASSLSFRYTVAIMSLGLSATIVLGVWMAFQSLRRPGLVVACLLIGTLLPAMLLVLGPHERATTPTGASPETGRDVDPGATVPDETAARLP